ncbi:MAG: serine/threonine-protein kinase [Kiritimatiellia bacterium]|jgi:serine/threonine protein kinase
MATTVEDVFEQELANEDVGEMSEFKTRLIPEQARAPVAPDVPAPGFGANPQGGGALDNYAIRGKIGSGGMGVVYLATDRRLGRYVAIKRLKPEFRRDLSIRRRFLREGKAAAALGNVHIAHIYSIGEDADGPYIVMEYVESALPRTDVRGPAPPQALEQYIKQNGPFKLEEALNFLLKIGRAIEGAHAVGVIHRDLKSSNILMDATGEPKIVDFGLARFTRDDAVSSLTVAGDKFVSLGYGAPEQEFDATLSDERADVYGLGALLYFCLTGKNPRFFREEDLPEIVRPVVCKALATDRDARYQSVVSFDAALLALLAESKMERPTIKTTWRCKWCDTVNPLATRFCGECGWDGREQCRECAADQQVGIQFCGVCGANAREYEGVMNLLRKIRLAIESRQYEWAYNYASQPLTFEPVGPNGRHFLDEIQSLGSMAQKRAQRRDQLREIIVDEMEAANYERAQRFILEFRELSPAPDAYAEDLASIPKLMHKRDLSRIEKAIAMKDWGLGERLLQSMTYTGEAFGTERARLSRLFKHHKRNVFALKAGGIGLALLTIYLLFLPMMVRLNLPGTRVFWRPAHWMAEGALLDRTMAKYASWWGVDDLGAYFLGSPSTVPNPQPQPSLSSSPDSLSAVPESPGNTEN